jgi:hypothetical protein
MAIKSYKAKKRAAKANSEFRIGLLWDAYTPRVESRIVQHLIALNNVYRGKIRAVVMDETAEKNIQRMASTLNIPVDIQPSTANVWSVYVVNKEAPVPSNAETVYFFNIGQKQHQIEMWPNQPNYPAVFNKGDERYVPPHLQLNLNRQPPRYRGWDPIRFWRFGI